MRKSRRTKLLILGAAAAFVLVLFFSLTPPSDAVIVRYRAGQITVPTVIRNVERIERYYIRGKLYQVVIYEKDAMVPVVFTPFDYVGSRKSLFSPIPVVRIHDEVYHTYDNVLQGVKYGLRKDFVIEKFQDYFDRLPTEAELYLEMDKLLMKVQLSQLDERLRHYPEAVFTKINKQYNREPGTTRQWVICQLLSLGVPPERVIALLGK